MTDHKQIFIDRVREVVCPMIHMSDDGFYVVEFEGPGFWTADSLRVIADYLDECNKPWSDMIDAELGKASGDTTTDSTVGERDDQQQTGTTSSPHYHHRRTQRRNAV